MLNSFLLAIAIVIPENCHNRVQVSCRQTFSCLPKAHHQLQLELLQEDMHWYHKLKNKNKEYISYKLGDETLS